MYKVRLYNYLLVTLSICISLTIMAYFSNVITIQTIKIRKKYTDDQFDNLNKTETIVNNSSLVLKSGSIDYEKLIDIIGFQFLKFSLCSSGDSSIALLLLVTSAPSHKYQRKIIRETWGAPQIDVKLVFLLGTTTPDVEKQLEKEQRQFRDIVQGNFIDSYKNLTYKHVMAYKYVTYHCSNIKYILKTDDDVFVNIINLKRYINEYSQVKINRLLLCNPMYYSPVLRNHNKWYVSYEEFPGTFYPPYCSGYAIILTSDTAKILYLAAQEVKYFWIEDVLITGVARKKTDIKITPLPSDQVLTRGEYDTLMKINNTYKNMKYNFLFGPVNLTPYEIRNLWYLVVNKKTSSLLNLT